MKLHALAIPNVLLLTILLIVLSTSGLVQAENLSPTGLVQTENLSSASLVQAESLSPARQIEVTVIPGKILPLLQGKSFTHYSVMVISDGKLVPIPFQFDDRNEVGLLYVAGGKLKVTGEVGILEEQDELAFMLKDTGARATANNIAATAGKVIYEIDIDAGSNKRYAYIVENNNERSEIHYTSFDKDTGLIKTTAYSLQVDPDNLLVWSDYTHNSFTENRNFLDTMKLRVRAKLGFIKATISNRLIPSEIVAVKNGPVKSIIEMDASISILGINIIQAGASVQISENTTQFPVFVTIPGAASVLSSLEIDISLDFHELEGARSRTELGPKEPVIAGGGGADPEELDVDFIHNWLSLSSGKNWDIIAFFYSDGSVNLTIDPLYKDQAIGNKPDKPERFKGSHPQMGYVLSDIPTGVSAMIGINLYYSDNFWQGNNPEIATNEISNPAPVNAIAL